MNEELMALARSLVANHIELCDENGELIPDYIPKEDYPDVTKHCFNLYTYLEELETEVNIYLDEKLNGKGNYQRFVLNGGEIARYLWCQMVFAENYKCYLDKNEEKQHPAEIVKFRGMDVLD